MNTLMTTLSEQLNMLQETAQTYLQALILPAQLLCGLFAFVYIGAGLWSSWAQGKPIDFYRCLKPFALGLVIVFFTQVTSLLHVVVYPIDLATQQIATQLTTDYAQAQGSYQASINDVRNNMAAYERNHGQDLATSEADSSLASQQLQTYHTTLQLLCNLLQMALTGVVLFIKVYVVVAQLILQLIGPFAFALALLPGFYGNVTKWLAHYLRILMYVPLCSLVSSLVAILFATCLYPALQEMLANLPATGYSMMHYQQATAYQQSNYFFLILFHGIAIALYTCIPTFSKWIISNDVVAQWTVQK